ncbi:TIGR00730 family Rossman fold protein [Elizabethkingia anophelis]|uniref:LOG family protein n=1 Tax=Elizabethkingia anophelis TaxID=1117645 RepID=UPI003786F9F5|nr:TIGR00730 family Rossman fold protein [Elizabethkingia anophelis]
MDRKINRITVFCGSSLGTEAVYEKQAYELGVTLAKQNIGLVYGGANVGLMGAVANGVIENGGEAIGVLPYFLKGKEIAHENLTELILVDTMHERKAKMNELSDGVISLPGGFGTLEELFEMITWAQLGLHQKPIGVLNINGFYTELLAFVQTMVSKGFLKEINKEMLLTSDSTDELLNMMKNYKAPEVNKWIHKEEI